jgi:hypothetical protein
MAVAVRVLSASSGSLVLVFVVGLCERVAEVSRDRLTCTVEPALLDGPSESGNVGERRVELDGCRLRDGICFDAENARLTAERGLHDRLFAPAMESTCVQDDGLNRL